MDWNDISFQQEMEAVASLSFITQRCLDIAKERLCWLLVYVKVSLQCCVGNSAAACLVMTMRLGGRRGGDTQEERWHG